MSLMNSFHDTDISKVDLFNIYTFTNKQNFINHHFFKVLCRLCLWYNKFWTLRFNFEHWRPLCCQSNRSNVKDYQQNARSYFKHRYIDCRFYLFTFLDSHVRFSLCHVYICHLFWLC